jgi:hypothetical protein
MVKIVILLLLGAVAAIGFIAAGRSSSFRYERRIDIKAKPEEIAEVLNDLRKGILWSPFEQLDPHGKRIFTGSETGVGAAYDWDGNKRAGAGRMVITHSTPSKITMTLDFFRPFKASNMVDFIMEPHGDTTTLIWAMYGPVPFIGKVMSLFIDCEKMIAGDFDKGLANLKALLEKQV